MKIMKNKHIVFITLLVLFGVAGVFILKAGISVVKEAAGNDIIIKKLNMLELAEAEHVTIIDEGYSRIADARTAGDSAALSEAETSLKAKLWQLSREHETLELPPELEDLRRSYIDVINKELSYVTRLAAGDDNETLAFFHREILKADVRKLKELKDVFAANDIGRAAISEIENAIRGIEESLHE